MKRIYVLTRGEVDKIVKKHLQEKGVFPEKFPKMISSMGVLSLHEEYKHLAKQAGTPWEEWPALQYSWEETIKE